MNQHKLLFFVSHWVVGAPHGQDAAVAMKFHDGEERQNSLRQLSEASAQRRPHSAVYLLRQVAT
jgi:hypothetical protein